MLLKCITLCCMLINVQTQFLPDYSQYVSDPAKIFYPGQYRPESAPSTNDLEYQYQQTRPSTSVEIQQSQVTEIGQSYEQAPNDNNRNLVNRQVSTPTTLNRQINQFGAQTPGLGQTGNWQPAPQTQYVSPFQAQAGQSKPANSQLPNYGQLVQSLPSGALALSPDVSDRQSDGPAGWPTPSIPSPGSSNFNSEQAPGFNEFLYSVTNFGINMLKIIDGLHPGNLVVSPFSITLLLGLIQQGASGQTLAQITEVLNKQSPQKIASDYRNVTQSIRSRTSSRNVLKVANNIFVADGFSTNRDFRKVLGESFNSEVTTLSFKKPDQAAYQINSWVASRTANQIQQLIGPDAIDYSTQMVLVNAVYFKGLWEVPFRVKATSNKEFHLSSGQIKTVPFMRARKLFKTGKDPKTNAEVIVLPFESNEYHMMVILPSMLTGMRRTLESLDGARLLSYLSFKPLETELLLPKFKIRADTDLAAVLKAMNVTDMFRRDISELAGIGTYGSNSPHISSAIHSATLSIDEKGGIAAAATAFAAVALSYDDPEVELNVNRPFIAVLWDQQSALPLFIAKIEDPVQ